MAVPPNSVGGVLQRIDNYPEHLRAIGLVITEFGRLEGTLALILWELIGNADRGDAVFYSLGSSKARCDVIRGVSNETLPEDSEFRKEVNAVVEDARGVADKRNDLAHGAWGEPFQNKQDPFCQIKRPASKNGVFSKRWTVAELMALADKIGEVEKRANKLSAVLRARWDPAVREALEIQAQASERARAYVDRFLPPFQ